VKLHPDPHLFDPMGSTLVVLGYAAAALLTAAAVITRRDA
jgi:hypothetical protein